MRWAFLLDVNKCLGCRSCEVACKNYYHLGESQRYRRVATVEWGNEGRDGLFFLSLACNHCESPECFRVCPERAYRKRRDGIVIHEARLCTGCCTCVQACPYGGPQYDADAGKVGKCNLCVGLLDQGEEPVCVRACHTEALRLLDLSNPDAVAFAAWVPGFPDTRLTHPAVRFVTSCGGDWKMGDHR
ncbi:MAG: 4Fe-4S dicluster domain-containing protein [Clostridia bacterium]|nr:MAG: 4Fe-4S dicluster domain-containing protein [Clostridia bacterium]